MKILFNVVQSLVPSNLWSRPFRTYKKWLCVALLAASMISQVAFADDLGLDIVVGAGIGLVIGSVVGGRDAAIVGGLIGAAISATAGERIESSYSYGPPPVYYVPPPVYYQSVPVYYQPVPVYSYPPMYYRGRHQHLHHHERD